MGKTNRPDRLSAVLKIMRGVAIIVATTIVAGVGYYVGTKDIVEGVQQYKTAAKWVGVWHFTHRDAQGNVLWDEDVHNALIDDGEEDLLTTYFRASTAPTQFYIGLTDSTSTCSIGETDSLTTINGYGEPSSNGYARQLVERSATGWPTSELDSGDWHVVSSTETFSASGGSWGPVYCAFLATTNDNSGIAPAFVALSQARTLADGESLDVSLDIKLQ